MNYKLLIILSLAPVVRALVAMSIAGAAFPLCGVMVLRLNLIPMRYMLMHGVILGGTISLALSMPMLPVVVIVNLILVALLMSLSKGEQGGFGMGSAAAMVTSMALASLIMHKAGIMANNTLNLLWGSPFALVSSDIVLEAVVAVCLVAYIALNIRTLLAIFYNAEVARSLGINVRLHHTLMLVMIALVIALAMKILGALLVDALLVLPVLAAQQFFSVLGSVTGKQTGGMKKLFVASSVCGFVISVSGFLLSLVYDLPPSAAIALVAGVLYLLFVGGQKAADACQNHVTF